MMHYCKLLFIKVIKVGISIVCQAYDLIKKYLLMCMEKYSRNKTCPFHIQTLEGMEENGTLYMDQLVRLSHFEFLWVSKGTGILCVDLQQYSLKENSMYFLSPGQCRQLKHADNIEGYFVQLTTDFFSKAKADAHFTFFDSGFCISEQGNDSKDDIEILSEMEAILQIMLKEYERHQLLRLEILTAYVKIFTFYISRCFNEKGIPFSLDREKEIVMTFMSLVKRNFTTKKMVTEYAAEMFISANYLNQVVKKISGFTASHHIQQCIILEAKRQVLTAPFKMKEVAYALGFDDYTYFSKYFKNNCGMSFSRFKKQVLHQSPI
jgi:AraC family transcriptional regulator, transcriptional activator of pobA